MHSISILVKITAIINIYISIMAPFVLMNPFYSHENHLRYVHQVCISTAFWYLKSQSLHGKNKLLVTSTPDLTSHNHLIPINANFILQLLKAKTLESLISLLYSHLISNPPANSVASIIKIYSESRHFSSSPLLSPDQSHHYLCPKFLR